MKALSATYDQSERDPENTMELSRRWNQSFSYAFVGTHDVVQVQTIQNGSSFLSPLSNSSNTSHISRSSSQVKKKLQS